MKNRLDNELIARDLFTTRNKAQTAIKEGNIFCDDKLQTKPGFFVSKNANIEIKGETLKYVSRGGKKLEFAIEQFNISFKNKIVIDLGSSTGGFTDCALQNNALKVKAIDVGNNQFDKTLLKNNAITLYENTDFRKIDSSLISDATILLIDVSFISITKMINKISELENVSEIICLVKPQFECGKLIADKYKGIIKDKLVHIDVLTNVLNSFNQIGFYEQKICCSPIKGGSGNIEYLVYFTKENNEEKKDLNKIVNKSFKTLNSI